MCPEINSTFLVFQDPSLSEDTRLRSVSNSSDKFPPASLNRARVTHQDQLPVSPGPGVTGVVPLPACVDTSVPPPALPTPPPPVSQSSPAVSFNTAKKKAFKIGRKDTFKLNPFTFFLPSVALSFYISEENF